MHRSTETAKSPVHDHEVSISHESFPVRTSNVGGRLWMRLEKTLAARRDMRAGAECSQETSSAGPMRSPVW